MLERFLSAMCRCRILCGLPKIFRNNIFTTQITIKMCWKRFLPQCGVVVFSNDSLNRRLDRCKVTSAAFAFALWNCTIDAWNKFYTWSHLKIFVFDSVILVHFCPKFDIGGVLGPLHYIIITLKSFTIFFTWFFLWNLP